MTVPIGPKKVHVPLNLDADEDLLPSEFAFTLAGTDWHVLHRDDVPKAIVRKAFTGGVTYAEFISSVLVPGEGPRFVALLGDVPADELAAAKNDVEAAEVLGKYQPADGLTERKIAKAYEAVASYITDFPMKLASPSGSGERPAAKKSAAGSRSKVSRPAKSTG